MSTFVAKLGWSRYTYVEFVTDERFTTLKACHENAFAYFQGCPMKCYMAADEGHQPLMETALATNQQKTVPHPNRPHLR